MSEPQNEGVRFAGVGQCQGSARAVLATERWVRAMPNWECIGSWISQYASCNNHNAIAHAWCRLWSKSLEPGLGCPGIAVVSHSHRACHPPLGRPDSSIATSSKNHQSSTFFSVSTVLCLWHHLSRLLM